MQFSTSVIGKLVISLLAPALAGFAADLKTEDGTVLASKFSEEVSRRLAVPADAQQMYGDLLGKALTDRYMPGAQYVVIVDRSPLVQAAMIYWMGLGSSQSDRAFHFIGASPISTGLPGKFEHFKTPVGVFEHTPDNPDFRAEGTKNEFGLRGYGRKGMRIYDFGWQSGVRGWGKGGEGQLRFQMHATDPNVLEPRVGTAQSKGCVRMPESLNRFIDRHGILDGDYEAAMAEGRTFWVLPVEREATAWSGRYLVVVDTERKVRPGWSPNPLAVVSSVVH